MSGTLEINGIKFKLPKKPAKKDILFSKKAKKNQKWQRTEMPEGMNEETAGKFSWFIEQEFDRRRNGVWFMNNGVPTYITGEHYYYINWCKLDIGYPEYRDRDRRFFIFWQACKQDPNCFGMVMVKHRREGASYKGAAMLLYEITSLYNAHGGIISKTGVDAKALFTDKLVYMFRQLPFFFQPIIDGSDNPKSTLSFNAPGQKISKNFRKIVKSEALNSKIDWRNTKDNSYDSVKLVRYLCDEGGKWVDANVEKNWQVVRSCLTLGDKIIGKCFMPTTVNEMSDAGGENFKNIWDDSDIEEKNANGRTRSGMYSYFTPAYDGYEGFIDEYGMSVVDTPTKEQAKFIGKDIGAKEYLQNVRESYKKNTTKLSEEKRQRPFSVDEAFRNDSRHSPFDVERIYQQMDYNEAADNLTVTGSFIWKNGQQDSKVIWIPSSQGKWKISWLPPEERSNNIKMRGTRKFPANEIELVAGCDPYDHDTTTDGRRSNAACYVFKKFTMMDDFHNQFVCEYIARPPKAEMFYEDVLKTCVFYGCPILVENNKVGIIKYFERRGYYDYLMDRPESTHTDNTRKQQTKGIPSTGVAVLNAQTEAIATYVYDYIGLNQETEEMGKCYFNRLLDDWSRFEPDNRTKYDATVASSLALLASQKHVRKKEIKVVSLDFIKRYSNKGIMSKRVKWS
tara:strand:- start:4642 stop:6675 length:2034 start_codon:yes stop_codon:yes gene_type:complete